MRLRFLWAISVCIFCLIGVFLLPQQVQAAQCDGFTYEVHDGKATITGSTQENLCLLEIPQTIDGYPVVSIGAHAFEECDSLLDVEIPEGVETIEAYAFYQCMELTWVELPSSLVCIGDKAFFNCKSLEDVYFGYGLKNIGYGAFSFCTKLGNKLILPYKLESIDNSAFYACKSLCEVVLPDSLKELGTKAFSMCNNLNYIYIPSGVEYVGSEVLYDSGCYNDSSNWYGDAFYIGQYLLDTKKTISGSYTVKDGTVYIAEKAFRICGNLTEVILPDSVQIIGDNAFEYCDTLERISMSSGVKTIGNQAFYWCESLSDIQIPDSVMSMGQDAFAKTAYYKNSENWENDAFYAGNHLVSCKNTVAGEFQVRQGTKTIVSGAMKGLTKVTQLTLPESLIIIGDEAMAGCTALSNIVIPNGVTNVASKAFYGCSSLKSVYLGKHVSQIGTGAFGSCASLEDITVHSENETYRSQNNCVIRIQDKSLVIGCKASSIPADGSVTSIGNNAFEGCIGLTEVNIPNTVLTVGDGAFRDCDALKTVNLGDDVQVVGKRAFEQCDVLCQINLGHSLHTIDDYGFAYNHMLTEVEFPASLRYLGEEAFSNGTGLVSVRFQEGLLSIGKNCFCFCENLTSLHLPDSVEELKDGAFYACEKLADLTLGDNLLTIGSTAFSGCEALQVVSIPERVEIIDSSAFYECTSLRLVDLGNVKKIGYSAFESCSSLTQIHIPASVTELGNSAFAFCPAMEQMTVSSQNQNYHSQENCIIHTGGKSLIAGCKNSIIPADDSVTVLDDYSFAGCTGLKSIVVPKSVTRICSYAFYYCSGLEYMQLPFVGGYPINYTAGDNTMAYIFGGSGVPGSLKRVVFTGGTSVGDSGFQNCNGLEEIVFAESTVYIGYDAFENCQKLQRVIIPGDLKTLKDPDMFAGSPKAMLYISAGQENTKALAHSNGIPYIIGGLITFNDDKGELIDKAWYSLNAKISTPVVPEKPADAYYTFETSWEPVPDYCTGNQDVQLRYIAHWIGGEIPGDMNGDGVVTDADAIYLLRFTLFPESFPVVTDGDINRDGQITDADAVYLLRYTLFPDAYPLYPA